jgi:phosphoenolpyruvate-protein phosphotransferase (PTS system enzyme I)
MMASLTSLLPLLPAAVGGDGGLPVPESATLVGIAASPGLVMGPIYVHSPDDWLTADRTVPPGEAAAEFARLGDAIAGTRQTIDDLRERLTAQDTDVSEGFIFQSHMSILDDPMFRERVRKEVLDNHRSADSAVSIFVRDITEAFLELDDRYFQEKAADVQDVMRHLMYSLNEGEDADDAGYRIHLDSPHIVIASELTPSDTVLLPKDLVLGLATERGGPLSHVAILANTLQLPAAVGFGSALASVTADTVGILDGTRGELTIHPTQEQIDAYGAQRHRREQFERGFDQLATEPAVTQDGTRVHLLTNLELADTDELAQTDAQGADGVGLYRTEYAYLASDALPAEDDLFDIYRAILASAQGRPVTFRTVDLGGEKVLPLLDVTHNVEGIENVRGVRLCLRYPRVWEAQLRALWRACAYGEARVMFPMVPGVAEFRAAKHAVHAARDQLQREGIPCADELEIGAMIELPSAVTVADLLAEEADFLSIGTNDLIPYSLGLDRAYMDRTMVSEPYHPGILRAILRVAEEGQRHGAPVTVCGEMAGDPFYVLPLIAMGVRSLSMSAASIPQIKRVVRSTTVNEAKDVLGRLLDLPTAEAVDYELHRHMLEHYAHLLVSHVAEVDSVGPDGY